MDIGVTLKKNLNYYMKSNNKLIIDISKDLKIPYSTVSDWVHGKAYPRPEKIEILAKYFNVSYNDLVCDNEHVQKNNIKSQIIIKQVNEETKPLTLRALRVNMGLSLEDVSAMLNVSKETISNWERGYTYPNVQQIIKLEKVYNIKIFTNKVNFFPRDNK